MSGVAVAVCYGAIALAGNFVHKAAMMLLPLPNTVLLLQLITMYMVLKTLQRHGILDVPAVQLSKMYQLLPLCLLHCGHALLVLRALSTLNVPMYNTLKRTTPVMVLTFKAIAEARLPDIRITLSVLVIVSGCILAGAGDLSFDAASYSIALLCAFAQALYILLAEHAGPTPHSNSHPTQQAEATLPSRTPHDPTGAGGGAPIAQWLKRVGSLPSMLLGLLQSAPSRHSMQATREGWDRGGSMSEIDRMELVVVGRSDGERQLQCEGEGLGTEGEGAQGRGKRLSMAGSGADGGDGRSGSKLAAFASTVRRVSSSGVGGSSSSPAEIVHVLCLIGIPLLTVFVLVSGEAGMVRPLVVAQLRHVGWFTMLVWMMLTAGFESLLTGSLILCTQVNSALTTSIVGVLKGLGAVVLGFFVMTRNVPWSAMNVWGIVLNTTGGICYAWVKYQQQQQQQPTRVSK
ncbi:MAG: hypothetical protein WDW38_003065 [Sanguina aurantia]